MNCSIHSVSFFSELPQPVRAEAEGSEYHENDWFALIDKSAFCRQFLKKLLINSLYQALFGRSKQGIKIVHELRTPGGLLIHEHLHSMQMMYYNILSELS